MDGPVTVPGDTPHELINPESMAPPIGYSHVVAAAPGRLVFMGGQAGHGRDDTLPEGGLVSQFDAACANVATALAAAGGRPEHLVSMQIFVTDAGEYRANLSRLGEAWRRHLGRHYPAVGLFEVRGLFDPRATVELMAIAVIPE